MSARQPNPPQFLTRERLLQRLPAAAALFEHSDNNIRTGNSFMQDGQRVSTRSITISDPRLNNGRPTLIPSAYEGRIVPDREAVERAIASKKRFPSGETFEELDKLAPLISRLMGPSFAKPFAGRVEK